MLIKRMAIVACSWLISAAMLPMPVSGQSKYAPLFEKFRQTGDDRELRRELIGVNVKFVDLDSEVPVLLEVISSARDPTSVEQARGFLMLMAMYHPLEGEKFHPAISVLERHLSEALADENSKWGVSIVGLTAYVGLTPSSQGLALMYRMAEYKDESAQGLAILALAKLKPIPPEAKQVLFTRLNKIAGKISGPPVLSALTFAISDPDVLQAFVTSAESEDVDNQRIATQVLSSMSPIPRSAVNVFRRLQQRKDLDEQVAANVRAAADKM